MLLVILFEFIIVLGISLLWASGISKMHEEHPNYKGEDFLNQEKTEDEKQT